MQVYTRRSLAGPPDTPEPDLGSIVCRLDIPTQTSRKSSRLKGGFLAAIGYNRLGILRNLPVHTVLYSDGTKYPERCSKVTRDAELKLLIKTLYFAANKHRNQRRKNVAAAPYINHPISLVNILCNEAHITDVNVICAALLHDTVEDTETTAEELLNEFGQEIRDIVMEVTDDKSIGARQKRKQLQIEHASQISDSAKLLKLADKISNLRDLASDPPAKWSLERQREYFDWAKQVIDQLRGTHSGLEELFDEAYSRRV